MTAFLDIVPSALATIGLGIAILMAARIVCGLGNPFRDDLVHMIISICGWSCIVGGSMAVIFALTGPLIVPLWLLAIPVAFFAAAQRRANRRRAFLSLLATATERRMPLGPTISAFARETPGNFGRSAMRLAELTAQGLPLSEALRRCRQVVPAQAIPMIETGQRAGSLDKSLRQAAAQRLGAASLALRLQGRAGFVLTMLVAISLVTVFIAAKIIPQYHKIFADFGTRLPPVTQFLIGAINLCSDFGFVLFLFVFALIGLLCYFIARNVGIVSWDLPGTGWITRRFDTAAILESLALAIESDLPIPEALDCLSEHYPKWVIRRRLRSTRQDVAAGRDWIDSIRRRGLIREADRAILLAAQRSGNLAWAAREMADSNRRQTVYRYEMLVDSLFLPVLLAFTAIVALIAVAMFYPLVQLIQRLV
jgi:type IV pilus assembly protein PilC